MSKIESSNAAFYHTMLQSKKETRQMKAKKETDATTSAKSNASTKTQLSQGAQKLLEKLKKNYSNMDFMVADFANGDDAREILARGTKEFSVLFSSEELEKMASDEKYEKEYISRIEGAVRMSKQINAQFGTESGFSSDSEKGEISKIGISFNQDGTMTYFAELQKTTDKQKERIESAREQRAKEKHEASRKAQKRDDATTSVKRTTVEADSAKSLLQKMLDVDWSKIPEDTQTEGKRFDFTV